VYSPRLGPSVSSTAFGRLTARLTRIFELKIPPQGTLQPEEKNITNLDLHA
jgi:hypothetical protein